MPEAKRVVWAPRAKQDLRSIWRYYARVASPEVADNLLRDIAQASDQLRVEALTWRKRDEVAPGLRAVLVRPYTIFYRVQIDAVQIARVLHERRNFGAAFKGE